MPDNFDMHPHTKVKDECHSRTAQESPKARNKKDFGSGDLIFENWSGGPVDLFSFFLNHNINLPNLIFQQALKLEIQIKPVLI